LKSSSQANKWGVMNEIDELSAIVALLRSENGCNWDKKQTMQTLREFLLEETYEVIEAVETNNTENLKEELGDLLFNILFYARIAEEENKFQFKDVAKAISEKLIRRHPHIFAAEENLTADEVLVNWNRIKAEEKKDLPKSKSILDDIPKSLSSVLKAEKIQSKVSKIGFDWENIQGAREKLQEELQELNFEIDQTEKDQKKIEEEFGDVLFSLVNMSRFLKISPEIALNKANLKFQKRFHTMESILESKNQTFAEKTFGEMDELWEIAKSKEKE
jgi:MazG family protein